MRFPIADAWSPNANPRPEGLEPSLVVLHYTGMIDGPTAISRLKDPGAKVSAHYVVEEDGRILRLVEESQRAWHAGVSFWRGITDVNSHSIGVEIVNGGHDFGLPDYPELQIEAVIDLLSDILRRRRIPSIGVIGHSDVAPARKDDPGEKFPWRRLAQARVAVAPRVEETSCRVKYALNESDPGVTDAQTALAAIGYGLELTGALDEQTQCVVRAFQRRFRPQRIDGALDLQTLSLIAEMERLASQAHSSF